MSRSDVKIRRYILIRLAGLDQDNCNLHRVCPPPAQQSVVVQRSVSSNWWCIWALLNKTLEANFGFVKSCYPSVFQRKNVKYLRIHIYGERNSGIFRKNPHFTVLALFRTPLQNPPNKFFCNLLEKG